jgi:hypothetical protein
VLVPSVDEKKSSSGYSSKKESVAAILLKKMAIAQGIVAVLDGRNYVRLYENMRFVSV